MSAAHAAGDSRGYIPPGAYQYIYNADVPRTFGLSLKPTNIWGAAVEQVETGVTPAVP
ncbi:hypothetical protein ACIP9X_20290 [Arthrobacter sp. NPDC093125]|uniref:hypothetical protein n=1 Tax=Arthrobacter sp. NPDC093125 TaxID=3363944 RepID=UPI00382FE998